MILVLWLTMAGCFATGCCCCWCTATPSMYHFYKKKDLFSSFTISFPFLRRGIYSLWSCLLTHYAFHSFISLFCRFSFIALFFWLSFAQIRCHLLCQWIYAVRHRRCRCHYHRVLLNLIHIHNSAANTINTKCAAH